MKLAIADPPYPPMFSVRRDVAGGAERVTVRSRATRWYGEGPRSKSDPPRADLHLAASEWDKLGRHRALLEHLLDAYDGWAIATTPDGLGAYHPLPIACRVMAWVRPDAIPGGHRLVSTWEPVIVYVPEGRRSRFDGRVRDVLTSVTPKVGFIGSKPAIWTNWVLDALGHEPGDTVADLFPGSGAVAAAVAQRLPTVTDPGQPAPAAVS